MTLRNKVQLITYPDSLGGTLSSLRHVLERCLPPDAFGGIHILPPFPSSADRGFAPITYEEIDPRFGTWEDIRALSQSYDILIDLMVNHISRRSEYFQDFAKRGRRSPYADMFITVDKVWPAGSPPPEHLARIFLRKPEHPFSDICVAETGETERVWTSFGTRDWSEQIDLDINSPLARRFLLDALTRFSRMGVRLVRLDAIGYVAKKAGTSCFMVEPDVYQFLDWLAASAAPLGLELLPEVHANPEVHQALSARGYWTYDFVLPMLVLEAILHRSSSRLKSHLASCPSRQFTVLDCHDGIPVQPDVDGVLPVEEARDVVRHCVERGANLNRILSRGHVVHEGFDVHQINTTYYSALDCNDDAYLAARAIQFFAPGIPQVYYVGLLAGANDVRAVEETGEGRAINRHNYSLPEIEDRMRTEVVQRLLRLIRLRNTHPAFHGALRVEPSGEQELILTRAADRSVCTLFVDLRKTRARIVATDGRGSSLHIEV